MTSEALRSALLSVFVSGFAFGANSAAPNSRDASDSGRPASATSARGGRGPARGILPDPALLDGSGQLAEKKPEQGMLGDFELPGDDNAKNGKVGGQQGQKGQQAQQGQQVQQGGAGGQQQMPQEMTPQSGGEAGQQQAAAAAAGAQPAQGSQSAQGAQANAPQSANSQTQSGTEGGSSGPGDPNAKAEGVQVGQLDAGGPDGQAAPDGTASKPQPVAIGDSAMQIKTVANAPGIVGAAVPAGQTQQMEKSIGGGRGSGSSGGGGRSQSEKGRAMPAGL